MDIMDAVFKKNKIKEERMKKAAICMAILGYSTLAMAGGEIGASVEPAITVPESTETAADKSGFYAGIGLGAQRTYSVDSDFFDDAHTQDRTVGAIGLLGYQFNDYLAAEGRIGKSIGYEGYADVLTYSLFVKPQYPVTPSVRIYALLGMGSVRVEGESSNALGYTDTEGKEILDETGFQWGVGGSYALMENISVFADYTSLAKDADISSALTAGSGVVYDELSNDALTVGVTYQF